jgi:dimethylhistidine N-methyltransferase
MITKGTTFESAFAEDVYRSLQLRPRQLPSHYLYDALGSALFDAICELPWYGITRAESRLLRRHRADIFCLLPDLTRIVELGPGDGRKLRLLLEGTSLPMAVHLVDVSGAALARAAQALAETAHVSVVTHEASFEHGLDAVGRVPAEGDTLVLLLGSNIGNFDSDTSHALLRRVHGALGTGGTLLIGTDLVKPERDLLRAYDDPLGVSAAFNLNVLLRINRELGGNFDLAAYRHRAVWNPRSSRMEMYLVATTPQVVRIAALDLELELAAEEAIWTESSYKDTAPGWTERLEHAGFETIAQWIDNDDGFALSLARTVQPTNAVFDSV